MEVYGRDNLSMMEKFMEKSNGKHGPMISKNMVLNKKMLQMQEFHMLQLSFKLKMRNLLELVMLVRLLFLLDKYHLITI